MQLTAEQSAALAQIVELRESGQKEIRLAGPAGTGKTTLIRALIDELAGEDIEVVTPTNKAAKVLSTKGVPARTLFAVFFTSEMELNPKLTEEDIKRLKDAGKTDEEIAALVNEQRANSRKLTFHPNHTLPVVADGKRSFANTVVLDEASMLQSWLLGHLRKMCKTIILVGDPHQLPPVNDTVDGGYFCTRDPHVALVTVMRQASGSPILDLASNIREGRFPDPLVQQVKPPCSFREWFTPATSHRKFIAFTNAHRRKINMLARAQLGHSGVLPKAGERLVCNTNVDGVLLNGTEVVVLDFSWESQRDPVSKQVHGPAAADLLFEAEDGTIGTVKVNIGKFLEDLPEDSYPRAELSKTISVSLSDGEGASFSFGYCLTAHKAQGSEWTEVCVIDERFVLAKVDPTGATARRWIYTAITRASQKLVFAEFQWVVPSRRKAA